MIIKSKYKNQKKRKKLKKEKLRSEGKTSKQRKEEEGKVKKYQRVKSRVKRMWIYMYQVFLICCKNIKKAMKNHKTRHIFLRQPKIVL